MTTNPQFRAEASALLRDTDMRNDEIRWKLIAMGMNGADAEQLMLDIEKQDTFIQRKRNRLKTLAAQATNRQYATNRSQYDHQQNYGSDRNESAERQMLVGGLMCMVGLVVTVGSMLAAADGGTYVVAFGAIIGGAIQFARGFFEW